MFSFSVLVKQTRSENLFITSSPKQAHFPEIARQNFRPWQTQQQKKGEKHREKRIPDSPLSFSLSPGGSVAISQRVSKDLELQILNDSVSFHFNFLFLFPNQSPVLAEYFKIFSSNFNCYQLYSITPCALQSILMENGILLYLSQLGLGL